MRAVPFSKSASDSSRGSSPDSRRETIPSSSESFFSNDRPPEDGSGLFLTMENSSLGKK